MPEKIVIEPCLLHGEKDLSNETSIYKYLSTESFLYLTTFHRLIYSRINSWPDSFEGYRFEFLQRIETDPEFKTKTKNDFYGSCWSLQTDDICLYDEQKDYETAIEELERTGSAAMWESYCKNGGVRIKTSIGKLNSLFERQLSDCRIFRGNVYYEPAEIWSKTLKTPNLISTLFHKRIPFRYESEYRYILVVDKPIDKRLIYAVIDDLYDFIDEILISPATQQNKWISRTLCNIGIGISINTHRDTNVNIKNGNQFCRVSGLYSKISSEIGHFDMS